MTLGTTQIANLITDVGFPVAVVFLMYNMVNGILKSIDTSINNLKIAVEKLSMLITERIK